ncbi:MAG: hypothetical protein WC530_01300 [Candidatus Omnitrophota bacterium]
MDINWDIVIKIIIPFGTLILGKYLDDWLSKKPKLISYLVHASAFNVQSNPPCIVYTHSIVVRNVGRKAAHNVRIGHNTLPDNYQLFPAIPHSVEGKTDAIREIVIPQLVPNEQITVSYLYAPPLIWSQINTYTKSDEGFAKILNVLPTPQLSKKWIRILRTLLFFGVIFVIYLIIELIKWFILISK